MAAAQAELAGEQPLEFIPGVSYRNLLLYRGASKPAPFGAKTEAAPPHDLTDKPVASGLPHGPGHALLNELIEIRIGGR